MRFHRGVFFWRTPARSAWLSVTSLGFSIGAATHAADILAPGWRPYASAPLPIELFWTSLIAVDVAIIVLLVLRPRAGLIAALLLMVTDVSVNSYAALAVYPGRWWWPALWMQGAFLLWIALTAPWLLARLGRERGEA